MGFPLFLQVFPFLLWVHMNQALKSLWDFCPHLRDECSIYLCEIAQFRRTFTLIFENTWEKRWTTIGKINKMKISERKAKWSCHVKPLHYWAMWDAHQLQNLECTFKSKIWKPETENNFFFPVQFSYLWDMNDTLHVSYKISLLLKCQVVENQKNILV